MQSVEAVGRRWFWDEIGCVNAAAWKQVLDGLVAMMCLKMMHPAIGTETGTIDQMESSGLGVSFFCLQALL